MKIKYAIALLAIFFSGCASQIMNAYIGKDVREIQVDYGPPSNAFDMGDGRRAFQWVMNKSYTTPTTATTYGTVDNYGYTSWVSTNTTITGGQVINSKCVYTMFARWNEEREGWVVVGYKSPRLMCQ